jgi:phospholipid/cholesterol/gamma-HCH transport system permease protein
MDTTDRLDKKETREVRVPRKLEDFLMELAELWLFFVKYIKEFFNPRGYDLNELLRQCYLVGIHTLGLVTVTGFIMGLVLTLQSRPIMIQFGAEALLPSMVSISIVREIGPVITALICAGKIGSGIGAELGSMKVTEQIDAMEVSGTNPYKYLVTHRVLATTLMIPLLVVFSDAVSMYGSYIGVNIDGKISPILFFNQAFRALTFSDVLPAFVKTFFFGFAIGFIGCFKGFAAERGTEGVGQSANSAVVVASLAIFLIDMVAVQITNTYFM